MTIEQKRNLETWIAALRSGKYPQTIGMLHRLLGDSTHNAGHCCIGVAELCVGKDDDESMYSDFYFEKTFGLKGKVVDNLVNMNDTHKKSFSEIANYLETFLKD